MKRILICGSNGLLGQRLALMLSTQTDYEVLNTSRHRSFVFDHRLFDYTQLDITRRGDVRSLVGSFQPDVILNAAAESNVDWCERNREAAWSVNVTGVEHLMEAARKVGAHLVHVSSDYVFDGTHGPYDEDARPNPLNYYGKTKLAAENAIRSSDARWSIVRPILVYGYGLNIHQNFALWVVSSLRKSESIRCYTDQLSNPTAVTDLAIAMLRIFELGKQGVYHVCGADRVSRCDFARAIAGVFNLNAELIQPVSADASPAAARRPRVTGFITLKAETDLGIKPMGIQQGLTLFKREFSVGGRA